MSPKNIVVSRHWASCMKWTSWFHSLTQMFIVGPYHLPSHIFPTLPLIHSTPAPLALLLAFYYTQHIPIPESEPWGSLDLGYSSSNLCKSQKTKSLPQRGLP